MVARGWKGWGDVGQQIQTSVIRGISSRNLVYSMVTIINNTVLYTWKLLWKILIVLTITAATTWQLCEVKNVLTNPTVVNIPQYIRVQTIIFYALNWHNLICQLYVNKVGRKENKLTDFLKIMMTEVSRHKLGFLKGLTNSTKTSPKQVIHKHFSHLELTG